MLDSVQTECPVNVVINARAMRQTPYEAERRLTFYQLRHVAESLTDIEVDLEIDDIRESEPEKLYQAVIRNYFTHRFFYFH